MIIQSSILLHVHTYRKTLVLDSEIIVLVPFSVLVVDKTVMCY